MCVLVFFLRSFGALCVFGICFELLEFLIFWICRFPDFYDFFLDFFDFGISSVFLQKIRFRFVITDTDFQSSRIIFDKMCRFF